MAVKVFGASDDLIEIEGDIEEEVPVSFGPFLAFSNGTLATITYAKQGVWRINVEANGDGLVEVEKAPLGDDDNYSDILKISEDVHWLVVGQLVGVKSLQRRLPR